MKYNLKELVDVEKLQKLTNQLYEAAKIPSAIITMDGEILTGSGWQKICTDFHRKHPEINKECIASDILIRKKLEDGEPFCMYTCPRGLTDASVPIIIDGEHIANAFAGQLFLEEPNQTTEVFFRKQAKLFNLDETAYMEAFKEIPVIPVDRFKSALLFLAELAQMIAEMGLQRKKELLTQEELRQSEERYRLLVENHNDLVVHFDADFNIYFASQSYCKAFGKSEDEIIGQSFLPLVHEEDIDLVKDSLNNLKKPPHKTQHIERAKTSNGWKWFSWNARAIINSQGEISSIVSVGRDITKHKEDEDEIRKFRTIADKAVHGSAIADLNGDLIYCNDYFANVHGYSSAELIGKNLSVFHNENQLQRVGTLNKQLQENGSYPSEEVWHTHKDGTEFPMLMSGILVNDNTKTPQYLAATAIDITKFHETEQNYQTIFTEMLDGFALHEIICDQENNPVDYRYIAVNPSFEKMTGLKANDIKGKTVKEVLPGTEDSWIQTFGEVALTGKPALFENYSAELGKHFTVTAFQPKPNHFACIFADITEQKQARTALIESEEKFRTITEQIADLIALTDFNGTITYASPSSKTLFAIEPEEMVGRHFIEFLDESSIPKAMEAFQESIEKSTNPNVELLMKRQNGVLFHGELTGSIYKTSSSEYTLVVIRDISERKNSEKQEHQLQHSQKMESVGRLAGGVAHDFNNILTGISGNIALAMMDISKSDPLMDTLEEIGKATESAGNLTRQLLAFSRKQIIQPIIINLNDLINNMSKMLIRIIGEDVDLQTVYSDNLGSIKADPGQIEQVLVNLAVNSRDAMPDGGKLIIETNSTVLDEQYCENYPELTPGEYIMLIISDSGEGIDNETLQKIFDPFFTTKSEHKGTGLGLAMVYGIVKQHHGHINVYSEQETGTTFKLYFPRVEEKATSISKGKLQGDLPTGSETILVVEDEQMVRNIATKILKRQGYTVFEADSGGNAIALVENKQLKPDLLLTDIIMPHMNGRELADKLTKKSPELKVLYTSGYTEDVIAHHGVLEKGLNFLAKPYSPQILAQKVRKVLDS